MNQLSRRGVCLSAIIAGGVVLGATQAHAARLVLGDAASLAVDQPRAIFELMEWGTDSQGNPELKTVGPNSIYNTALLDTGANGILLGQWAYFDGAGINNDLYEQAVNPTTGQKVWYDETGVGPVPEELAVYKPYTLHVNGYKDTETFYIDNIRAFGKPTTNLGSFSAIIGMPAMMGKYTYVNLSALRSDILGGEFDYISSNISQTKQTIAGPQYDIDLRMVEIPHTGQRETDDPTPTYAPLPVIDNIVTSKGASSTTGSFLLDTGAQTNIISTQMALDMGLDLDDSDGESDIQDYLTVGGIGGQAQMPLVVLDELALPTADGDTMVWTNVVVGVLDIQNAPFDAVFGMNMLTSGYDVFGGDTSPEAGFFDGFRLDFNQGNTQGTLTLDWNEYRTIPEPASALIIGAALIVAYTRRPRQQ